MNDDPLLTTDQVLEYLNLNLKTVYRLIKSGQLPAVRVGRQWRFKKRDLDIWVMDKEPNGTWGPPRHLGDRVNGPGDEHYVTDTSDPGDPENPDDDVFSCDAGGSSGAWNASRMASTPLARRRDASCSTHARCSGESQE